MRSGERVASPRSSAHSASVMPTSAASCHPSGKRHRFPLPSVIVAVRRQIGSCRPSVSGSQSRRTASPTATVHGSPPTTSRHHPHALGEVDQRDRVGLATGHRRVARLGHHADRVDRRRVPDASRHSSSGDEAVRADLAREPVRLARTPCTTAAGTGRSRVACPERLAGRATRAARTGSPRRRVTRVASVPSTIVDIADSTPPLPWATATSAPSTWRGAALAPQLARPPRRAGTCRTARDGCRRDRRRSCWSGSAPPGPSTPVGDERAALALRAEAEVLEQRAAR